MLDAWSKRTEHTSSSLSMDGVTAYAVSSVG